MAKNLVIVESPAKAKTINKILGKDFVVRASIGHVRDLPPKELGIDIEKGFKVKYVVTKEKVIKELRELAGEAEHVYLAPDPDREGEAIAWHLMKSLEKQVAPDKFYRVTYNEITAPAIKQAFSNPGQIDLHKVDAQQARRVVDRIVGYKVSPLLWRTIRGGQSAGRVQSVALRLVVEREDEINKFVPQEYWLLGARVQKQGAQNSTFEVRLAKVNGAKAEVSNEAAANEIRRDLEGRDIRVVKISLKETSRKAQPPFITSSLQQAGSRFFGFAPSRTMQIAQHLYEGVDFGQGPVGLITYMRTDSFSISKQAQDDCREFVQKKYGPEYLPEKHNFYKSRGSAQEAHEAIRPTDVNRTPEMLAAVLKPEELKLYRVIWNRFVASQMAPARIAQRLVEFELDPSAAANQYLFRASSSDIIFAGYMEVTAADERRQREEEKAEQNLADEEQDQKLPPLVEGERLSVLEWLSAQKFTQPPGRFTEASLVRALEENGVGRPSTYASILAKIVERNYVTKEQKSLRPTDAGVRVTRFLVEHLPDLFDVGFTASMEANLDHIEEGKIDWTSMLTKFYGDFQGWLKKADGGDFDPAKLREMVDIAGHIKEWEPAVTRGKKTYSDEKYLQTIRDQMSKPDKPVTGRQFKALKQVLCRYRTQIEGFDALVGPLGLEKELEEACRPKEPPRESSQKKLRLLMGVKYDEPRKVGKKTYDDKAFFLSLKQQVDSGRRLSENQVNYLNRLVEKYSEQIDGLDAMRGELDMAAQVEGSVNREEIEAVLGLMSHVKEWKPAVQRGRRTWDDKEFYQSLSTQFGRKKFLSEKQVASLKKLVGRYSGQIPGFDEVAERYGLSRPKKKGAEQE